MPTRALAFSLLVVYVAASATGVAFNAAVYATMEPRGASVWLRKRS